MDSPILTCIGADWPALDPTQVRQPNWRHFPLTLGKFSPYPYGAAWIRTLSLGIGLEFILMARSVLHLPVQEQLPRTLCCCPWAGAAACTSPVPLSAVWSVAHLQLCWAKASNMLWIAPEVYSVPSKWGSVGTVGGVKFFLCFAKTSQIQESGEMSLLTRSAICSRRIHLHFEGMETPFTFNSEQDCFQIWETEFRGSIKERSLLQYMVQMQNQKYGLPGHWICASTSNRYIMGLILCSPGKHHHLGPTPHA